MSAATGVSPHARCAIHPARPAIGGCPTCGRPRCAADAAAHGERCEACDARPDLSDRPAFGELLVRAGLAGYPLVLLGGWISTQYWHDRYFSVIVPGLVGLACAAAASAAGGRKAGIAVAVPEALLAVAFSYALVPGGAQLVHPAGQALPPYVAAALGVVAWPVLFGTGTGRPSRSAAVSEGSRLRR